jgi:hypothetical protein
MVLQPERMPKALTDKFRSDLELIHYTMKESKKLKEDEVRKVIGKIVSMYEQVVRQDEMKKRRPGTNGTIF